MKNFVSNEQLYIGVPSTKKIVILPVFNNTNNFFNVQTESFCLSRVNDSSKKSNVGNRFPHTKKPSMISNIKRMLVKKNKYRLKF